MAVRRNKPHIGDKIGKYTALSIAYEKPMPSGIKVPYWNCICECGKEDVVSETILKTTAVPMCAECREIEKDNQYIGKRFGKLTVVERAGRDKDGRFLWKCACDCGGVKYTITANLNSGRVRSCGCLHYEEASKRMKEMRARKGKRDKRLSTIWLNMKARCFNPKNAGYKNYGERGITVCDEWKESFENFYNWAINNGYEKTLSIDRIDPNGNYEPSNCRWTTMKVQQNNRTNNHIEEMNGESHTIAEWIEILNITKKKMDYLLSKGYKGDELYEKITGGKK